LAAACSSFRFLRSVCHLRCVIISRTTFRLFCCRYSAAWLFDGHFCQTTLSLPKNCRAFVGNSSLLTGQDV
ncbi:hypothetical protein, partial [Escherichia coli]|uniref:hypothetical protein n=1 Tax=Escherichia coli TaxID=562 RepID=UPI001A7E0D40